MIPFPAKLRIEKEVPVDPMNPEHEQLSGHKKTTIEVEYVDGILWDIIELTSYSKHTLLNGQIKNDYGLLTSDYREEIALPTGTYALFWVEENEYYKLMIVDYNNIVCDKKEMRNYIGKLYSK